MRVRLIPRLTSLLENPAEAKAGILLCLFLALTPINGFGQQITVRPNVQVSKARPDLPHYETLVAANPHNPRNLVGGSMVLLAEKNRYKVITYASFDGGQTWEPTLESDYGYQWGASDPAYAFGPDGTAYFAYIGMKAKPDGGAEARVHVQRSKDGGKTWLAPTVLPFIDREFVTVDNTGGKYNGYIYINGRGTIWTTTEKVDATFAVSLFRSVDGGVTFDAPVNLVEQEGNKTITLMGNAVVLSDGTVAVLFPQSHPNPIPYTEVFAIKPTKPNAWLKVATFEHGTDPLEPNLFPKSVVVSDWYLGVGLGWTSVVPATLAVDGSGGAFRDRLYAVFQDFRSGRSEILLATSSDKGKTWSRPVVVNDDRPHANAKKGPNHFMPQVAVNKEGVVGVMWYDRRDNSDELGYWVRFAASLDGGETFLPSVKVSEAPYDPDRTLFPYADTFGGSKGLSASGLTISIGLNDFTFIGGHTAGLAADADAGFHPFWVDNRTGVPQLWTTTVTVNGKAFPNGSAELKHLVDISEKVTFDLTNLRFDRTTGTVSLDALLVNGSKETLSGPLKVRVVSLQSGLGMPEVLNADNREKLTGAVWDFSEVLEGNQLKPGDKSKAKRLEFRLSNVCPLQTLKPSRRVADFVGLEVKVFGKMPAAPLQ